MNPSIILEENLSLIENIVRSRCRSHGIFGSDADDFVSMVRLELMEDDYKKIRDFKGRSTFKTYLHTVVSRIFLDMKRGEAGRWRPSAKAKRLGEIAVSLEQLIYRDGNTFEDACRILEGSHGPVASERLHEVYLNLPDRGAKKAMVLRDDELKAVSSADPPPDETMEQGRLNDIKRKIEGIVGEVRGSLSGEDSLILRMVFEDGFSISEAARAVGAPRRYVERKVDFMLTGLRERILESGIDIDDAVDAIKIGEREE